MNPILFAWSFWSELAAWLLAQFDRIRSWGEGILAGLLWTATQLFPTVDWSKAQDTMDSANYVFPLGEIILMGMGLMGLWLCIWVYRVVKSWIPTVAG